MKASVSVRRQYGETYKRYDCVHHITDCLISSAPRWHELLQLSQRHTAAFPRKDTPMGSSGSMGLRTSIRCVSSPPPSAVSSFSSDAPGQSRVGSAGGSDQTPSTWYSDVHSRHAQVVAQFSRPLGARDTATPQGRDNRERPRPHPCGVAVSKEVRTAPVAAPNLFNAAVADPPPASIGSNCLPEAPRGLPQSSQTSKNDGNFVMSPVLQQLCQHIGTGAWCEALKVLHRHEEAIAAARHGPAPQTVFLASSWCLRQSSAPTATEGVVESAEHSFVSLEEITVWLLLWCGHAVAAWYVWRRTVLNASLSSTSLPQLVLLLAFFIHIVERDAVRTRDMLLLFRMSCSGITSPREVENVEACDESPAHSRRVVQRLLWQWLWCCNECTLAKTSPSESHRDCLNSFLKKSVEQLVRYALAPSVPSTRRRMNEMAEVVALLLLTLRDVSCANDEWRNIFMEEVTSVCAGVPMQDSCSSCQSAPAAWSARENARRSPFAAPLLCAPMRNLLKSILHSAPSRTNAVGRSKGHRVEQRGHMRLQSIFSKAEVDRKRLAGVLGSAQRPANGCALEAFRMLHGRILTSGGFGAAWKTVRESLRPPSAQSQQSSSGHPVAPTDGADVTLQQLLQRIDEATARGDWTTALRLCLSESCIGDFVHSKVTDRSSVDLEGVTRKLGRAPSRCRVPTSTSAPASTFPFLHRLCKGLVACEVARPSGASWQGAMALWSYIRQHAHLEGGWASPCGVTPCAEAAPSRLHVASSAPGLAPSPLSLGHALGRIFFLLASSKRWAEALACFHCTPDAYLDGFVVSQVAYALRDSPSQHRSVVDLWAAWRCRVGDAVDPTKDMTHKLLLAMLQTSVTNTSPVATLSSTSFQSPTVVAAEVATALLVAAADTSSLTPATSAAEEQHTAVTPGTAVPVDWPGQRDIIRRVMMDRWVGGWADALRVALASRDVPLLVYIVLQRLPVAHVPSVCRYLRRVLPEKAFVVSPADRVSLFALWTEGPSSSVDCETGRGPGIYTPPAASAVPTTEGGGGVRKYVLNTEALLDELLGLK